MHHCMHKQSLVAYTTEIVLLKNKECAIVCTHAHYIALQQCIIDTVTIVSFN